MANCTDCIQGGPECSACLDHPENSTPVRLYTPKGAVLAMLAGKTLKNQRGLLHYWNDEFSSFWNKDENEEDGIITNFSGLFEEL